MLSAALWGLVDLGSTNPSWGEEATPRQTAISLLRDSLPRVDTSNPFFTVTGSSPQQLAIQTLAWHSTRRASTHFGHPDCLTFAASAATPRAAVSPPLPSNATTSHACSGQNQCSVPRLQAEHLT